MRSRRGELLPGSFHGPSSFSLGPSGKIYLVDALNFRVSIYDQSRKNPLIHYFSYGIDSPQKIPNLVSDIYVSPIGAISLLDYSHQILLNLTPEGDYLSAYPLMNIINKRPKFRSTLITKSERFTYLFNREDHYFIQWQPQEKSSKIIETATAPFVSSGWAFQLALSGKKRDQLKLLFNQERDDFTEWDQSIVQLPSVTRSHHQASSVECFGLAEGRLYFKVVFGREICFFSYHLKTGRLLSRGRRKLRRTLDLFRPHRVSPTGRIFSVYFKKSRLYFVELKSSR